MDFEKELETLLEKNQRVVAGNFFTVPSPERYPFQWLWDSCFHALMYASLNEPEKAKAEIRSLVRKQHQSGLLPHITFWHDTPNSLPNWGRELRGHDLNHVFGVAGTSSLTQPPLLARTVVELYQKTNDMAFLTETYPSLIHYFNYLHTQRTSRWSHLPFIINPDESGEDNARRFDEPLTLATETTDSDHLTRRLDLMEKLSLCDFDTKTCMRNHFAVIDVSFNCIYLDGLQAMSEIAALLGKSLTKKQLYRRISRVKKEIRKKLSNDSIHFYSVDVRTKRQIQTLDWTIFMPLFAGLVDSEGAEILVEKLFDKKQFWSEYGVRTLPLTDAAYQPDTGFWRGPVWFAPHYFIYKGLLRYGYTAEAARVKNKTKLLLENDGWREHYNGDTGKGFGAHHFTWGGLYLAMD